MSLQEKVLNIFKEINGIPRCSGNEAGISQYLVNIAKENNWEVIQDEVLNVIIKVPGKNGKENNPPVILQGHMDMVCVKEQEVTHNFCTDPIETYQDGDWLRAKGTTLGADNGIALAIALAIAYEKDISHPPLELLFTVDEERGLTGANALKTGILKGKTLLNIDSEHEGVFTIGCAGGRDTHINLPLEFTENKDNIKTFELIINKLSGGHSGIQIHQPKANAIQLAGRILNKILKSEEELYLCNINGGIAHNAIPREISVLFACNNANLVNSVSDEFFDIFKREYNEFEPEMSFSVKETTVSKRLISKESTKKCLYLLTALPHGVLYMSQMIDKLVETSNNLAQVNIINEEFQILLSQRSSLGSRLDYITDKIETVAKLAGAKVYSGNGYPAWEPDWNSKLLEKTKQAYQNVFAKEPKIEIIHAGLECGVIGSKYPEMDMISFGPTILSPHSPQERMKISDIDKILKFLFELFNNL